MTRTKRYCDICQLEIEPKEPRFIVNITRHAAYGSHLTNVLDLCEECGNELAQYIHDKTEEKRPHDGDPEEGGDIGDNDEGDEMNPDTPPADEEEE